MNTTCCHDEKASYPDHSGELGKLNRIAGQVEGVKKMIAERRYCPDILTQIRAIRAALKTVEGNILESHLESCLANALKSGDKVDSENKINEIKDILKRFGD